MEIDLVKFEAQTYQMFVGNFLASVGTIEIPNKRDVGFIRFLDLRHLGGYVVDQGSCHQVSRTNPVVHQDLVNAVVYQPEFVAAFIDHAYGSNMEAIPIYSALISAYESNTILPAAKSSWIFSVTAARCSSAAVNTA